MEHTFYVHSVSDLPRVLVILKNYPYRWENGNIRTIDPSMHGDNEHEMVAKFNLLSSLDKRSAYNIAFTVTDYKTVRWKIVKDEHNVSVEDRVWNLASELFLRIVKDKSSYSKSDMKFAIGAALDFLNAYPTILSEEVKQLKAMVKVD